MTISATRTYDEALILKILGNDTIKDSITEDKADFNDFSPDVHGECWLDMKMGDVTIGVFNLHVFNGATLQIHAHILPKFRRKYSRYAGIAALRWVYEEITTGPYHKVIAMVPTLYPNVGSYVESFGFMVEGMITQSYLKNDVLHDIWIFGITMQKIGEFLNGKGS